ncbi:MAG: ABC transporter permease [Flavobacteriales bacterium]|nr:ABC transporter permease [Flavobacteriales bacterium]
MNKIGLIIRREFLTRVRKPSFLIMTLLGPLLIAGGVTLAVYLGLQESGIQNVLVIDKSHLVTKKLKETDKVKFFYDHADWSDSTFKASPYNVMVDVNEEILVTNTIQLYYKELPSINTQRTIQAELEKVLEREKLRLNEVDPDTYARIKTALKMHLFDIDKEGRRSFDEVKAFIGLFFALLIYMFIFLYGVQVMRGVMEEKQNRIVEVLVSSVKPFQLMMGKITGIAMVGLLQFVLWVALTSGLATVGSAVLMKDRFDPAEVARLQGTAEVQAELQKSPAALDQSETQQLIAEITAEMPRILFCFLFYFIGGYLLYASLFAAIGAAVDTETDVQQFMLPVTLPMVLAIIISEMAMMNPDGPAVRWFSLIPLTSPVVMMIRVVMGNAFDNPLLLATSMVLLVLTFIATTWLAGRIYRTGILMYGKKVSWKELGKWLFYKG